MYQNKKLPKPSFALKVAKMNTFMSLGKVSDNFVKKSAKETYVLNRRGSSNDWLVGFNSIQVGHYSNYLKDHKVIHLDLTAATLAFPKEHLGSIINELDRYVPGIQKSFTPANIHAFGYSYQKSCEYLEKHLPAIKIQFDT